MVDKQHFKPFPDVDSRYGAQMGRGDTRDSFPAEADLCCAGPAGEYDSGGVYWGLSTEGGIWAVWERGNHRAGVVYVRASTRAEAKRIAIE